MKPDERPASLRARDVEAARLITTVYGPLIELAYGLIEQLPVVLRPLSSEDSLVQKVHALIVQQALHTLRSTCMLLSQGYISQAALLAKQLFEMRLYAGYIDDAAKSRTFLDTIYPATPIFSVQSMLRHEAELNLTEAGRPLDSDSFSATALTAESSYIFLCNVGLNSPPLTRFGVVNGRKQRLPQEDISELGIKRIVPEVDFPIMFNVLLIAMNTSFIVFERSLPRLNQGDDPPWKDLLGRTEKEFSIRLAAGDAQTPAMPYVLAHPMEVQPVSDQKFGSDQLMIAISWCFHDQLVLFKQIWKGQLAAPIARLMPLMFGIDENGQAIGQLVHADMINACLMVARSFIERVINCCYLLVSDEEIVDRYELHARQKAYRRLNREFQAGAVKVRIGFMGELDVSSTPELAEALEMFTSKRGKEITHWTPTTLAERIEVIAERSKVNCTVLALATLAIYEDASEALHGSLYGSTFHLGVFQPGRELGSEADLASHLRSNATMILLLCGLAVSELIGLVAEHSPHLADLVEQSKAITKKAASIMPGDTPRGQAP